MLFNIKLADRTIEVCSHYEWVFHLCKSYIVNEDCIPDFKIVVEEHDIEIEKEIIKKKISPDYHVEPCFLESHAIYRKIAEAMLSHNTILMHGSAISTNGDGYMIVAAAGVGKTLRSKLWVKTNPDSYILNGDKPLVHISRDIVTIYGTPWCGKEGENKNDKSPLRAIFFLERADKGEKTTVTEINLVQALSHLMLQTYFTNKSEDIIKTIQLFDIMARNVKFFKFRSTPTEDSVRLAYKTARPGCVDQL